MTYTVLGGMLHPTHSLIHCVAVCLRFCGSALFVKKMLVVD